MLTGTNKITLNKKKLMLRQETVKQKILKNARNQAIKTLREKYKQEYKTLVYQISSELIKKKVTNNG